MRGPHRLRPPLVTHAYDEAAATRRLFNRMLEIAAHNL
jgi:hypothetical protein